jgi:hypothetical protein
MHISIIVESPLHQTDGVDRASHNIEKQVALVPGYVKRSCFVTNSLADFRCHASYFVILDVGERQMRDTKAAGVFSSRQRWSTFFLVGNSQAARNAQISVIF